MKEFINSLLKFEYAFESRVIVLVRFDFFLKSYIILLSVTYRLIFDKKWPLRHSRYNKYFCLRFGLAKAIYDY